jgi:glycosyltransferase involved in cell wall biosynthesis/SAM-dependent methyltransferase
MLEYTGERFLPYVDPALSGAEIHYEHLHRYAFASLYVADKAVLDLASGEGYGTFLLSNTAKHVIGIDIDPGAVTHASDTYKRENIEFRQGSITDIPIAGTEIFDVIVCFEAIEHISDHETLFVEIKRLLKKDGILIISTPNKQSYSDDTGDMNPFHIKELYFIEFSDILKKKFSNVNFFGQKVFSGSSIYPVSGETSNSCTEFVISHDGKHFSFESNVERLPKFFIAIASENKSYLKEVQKSYLNDLSNQGISVLQNQIRQATQSIQTLNAALSMKEMNEKHLAETLSEKETKLSEKETKLSEKETKLSEKETQLQDLTTRFNEQEQKLSSIEKSIVWQFTMKFHNKIVRKLLPQNTRRRKYYNLGIDGGKILINDGFHAFYYSFVRHIHKGKKVDDYHLWIEKNEPRPEDIDQLKKELRNFSYHPKISIVTPVWNTDEKWLRLAIDSVTNQIYDNWELCIADGGSTKPYIKQVLNEYAQKDSRIKVKFLAENKGIAENSNEALSLATGEFIGFLDHDDELAPFALHEIVSLLNQNQNIDFVYSDEDKIDQSGNRKDPFFKPDWSPDLFLSQNYLCHLSIIRKTVIDNVEGFRTGYDGSQDYDLFLRCLEKISPSSIAHIPKILYHWRMIPGSAANDVDAKPYAITSAKKALKDALQRRVQDGIFPSSYRIRYAIQNNPLVSIIIPTKDNVDILKQCVHSILEKTDYNNYEIVIVDNQSKDLKTFEYYNSLKTNLKIKILHFDNPFNFSAINNYAVTQVDSSYILFLNNDTEVISGEWLSAMLEHAQRGYVGAVGAKLLYPNNLIQHAGVILGITGNPGQKGVAGHSHRYLPSDSTGYFLRSQIIGNYSAVTAACLIMRKEVFKEIGGFNEELAFAFNDVDLCLRIRSKGYLIVYTPYSLLYHHESLSRGYEDTPEKQARFSREVTLIREKWGTIIDKGDPYYNPNLTLNREDVSIRLEK